MENKLNRAALSDLERNAEIALNLILQNRAAALNGLAFFDEKMLIEDIDELNPDIGIKALRNFVDAFREGELDLPLTANELALQLGHLYTKLALKILDWEVCLLQLASMKSPALAIVDTDRKFALFPVTFFERLFNNPEQSNTLALTLNMLAAGDCPPVRANSYTVMLS